MTQTRKKIAFGFFGLILLVFLAANVAASHIAYSELMFRVMGLNDKYAAREMLVNLEGSGIVLSEGQHTHDIYDMQSEYLNSHFDNIFAREVDVKRLNVEKSIEYYEGLLALNGSNPQVLVQLGMLYKEVGNSGKSAEYFRKAQSVDPWVETK